MIAGLNLRVQLGMKLIFKYVLLLDREVLQRYMHSSLSLSSVYLRYFNSDLQALYRRKFLENTYEGKVKSSRSSLQAAVE